MAPQEMARDDNSEIEPDYLMDIKNKNKIPLWLAPCHLVAALFQCMQSLFLFAFSTQVDLQWVLFSNLPTRDDEVLGEDEYARPVPNEVAVYSITWYAGLFILFSGIDHIVSILPRTRQYHEFLIERHQSPFRWIEYSISSSLMRVHISQVAGITDVHILFLQFFLANAVCLFAVCHERLNAKARADGYRQDWFPFNCGVLAHVASWLVIFCYFFASTKREGSSPGFVSALVFSLFILELSFPTVFVLQWKKIGVFEDFLVGEFTFIMCSFTTKTFLAWTTLAGANAFGRRG